MGLSDSGLGLVLETVLALRSALTCAAQHPNSIQRLRLKLCDESGPPCNNCTLRNAKCEYAWAKGDKSTALAQSRKSSSGRSSEECSLTESGGLVMKECRRMLELELMHYWSTTTYESLCSTPEDHHYMRFIMPQEALRHDFLLNGIFVAAALQRSTMTSEPEARGYFNIAMELFNIAKTDFQGLLDSPVPLRAYLNYGLASAVALPPDTQIALSRVHGLNELYHSSRYRGTTPTSSDELSIGTSSLSDMVSPTPTLWAAATTPLSDTVSTTSVTFATPWTVAIGLLQNCFAEEQRAILRGFCFVFPGGAGPDFAAAVKAFDPMALLILMHWAVLIERAGNEFWWAKELGKRLAIGIWKAMQLLPPRSRSPILLTPEWGESISWVCGQLRLPNLVRA
ncbi:hypothetical protein GQX73_g1816 [Xylaria multiplex]|uniref:Zn(2)-C6 fungal-type domain-containing protein n=1 Tax=Xylaria multiplex TaxID=323545 RepID=A0A7C8ITB1_9PEZI|nr:hypothetical protein GQX73_g1816 [Xylaria multiplex]